MIFILGCHSEPVDEFILQPSSRFSERSETFLNVLHSKIRYHTSGTYQAYAVGESFRLSLLEVETIMKIRLKYNGPADFGKHIAHALLYISVPPWR